MTQRAEDTQTQSIDSYGGSVKNLGQISGATSKTGKKLYDKVERFQASRQVRAMGIYPFFREIESMQNPVVKINGQDLIMMGSNNYLGLVSEPRVIEAAIAAARKYGTGCAGSRLLNGTLDIHEELERKLAKFVGKEAALLYSTGYQSNVGCISAMVGRNENIVIDRRNHASIVDGVQLARGAKVHRYKHNDMQDFERVMAEEVDHNHGTFVIVDGVFSMEGDVVPLPEVVAICKKYNAVLLVDDAHGLGVLGRGGRGTCDHFHVTDDVDMIMGTFSKSLASIGGFIAADQEAVDYMRHHSRAMIFSASMPPASVGSLIKALDIIENEPERVEQLWKNTNYMRTELLAMGFDLGESTTPIMPLMVGEDLRAFGMCSRLHEEGVFVNPVPGLSLSPGSALIRISLMATHEQKHLDFSLEKIEKVGRELGIIPA